MAAPSAINVYRVPGKLIKTPTGYDPANNHGGTVMGSVTACWFDHGIKYARQYFDELGRTGDPWAVQKDSLFRFSLRSWDSDALGSIFPSFSGGVATIGTGQGPQAAALGTSWVFAPDNYDTHPAIYLPNGVPEIDSSEQGFRFSVLYELNIHVNILALPVSAAAPTSAKIGLASAVIP